MHGQGSILFLFCLLFAATPTSLTFNINVKDAEVYTGEQDDFFGYKVLQFRSGADKGIIVTAPLQLNGTGGICRPDSRKVPRCFNPKEISLPNGTVPVKHFGLSIAEDPTSSHFTVCSPSIAHECYENSYLNSQCYKMTNQLQSISSFTPNFQKCTEKTVDLVFLFDGSASMTIDEFNKNKDFIEDIMESLMSTSIKFAAVQFSSNYRKVFDFNDYAAGTALQKLRDEQHLDSLTNTHKALKYVMDQILENPASGASTDATKVLILITDGDPSDRDNYNIIGKYDEKNVIRFVIGVKAANIEKFRAIASEPKAKNAFKIENYDKLTGILENFQKKVFKLEGSKVARAGDMTNEMSQSGFSAVFHKDSLILGSVGSNSWTGSLQELQGQSLTQIEDPEIEYDSYMGYSVAVGERDNVPLYFTGAPRFRHTGQVILFKQKGTKWAPETRIKGDKFGSYFGAELCSVDINSDGNMDFLLVGAPLFYQPPEKREGQVYVYSLTDKMQLNKQLDVTEPSTRRFGTTISSLADLNGDGLRDVAIGAPLEDDNRGVVYIYLGDQHRGIRSTPSQRIMGQEINPGLRFFGQAIDGDIDLGDDGLPDIVVGSQGMAVVMSSRPVFNVIARLTFHPAEISTEQMDCVHNKDDILEVAELKLCFKKVETTKSKTAEMSSGLNISYTLDVDPMRQSSRGFFSSTDRKVRNHTLSHELHDDVCFSHLIYMTKCVMDTLSPLCVKLHFSQDGSKSASAVLNVDSRRQAVVEIPFERQCRGNDTCIAELEVDFNFTAPKLLVKEDNYFNVTIELSNKGDDSYNTSLTMLYPPGLSFSRMTPTKWTRQTLHSCHDLDVLDKTICSISLPVYRSRTSVTFQSSFLIMTNYQWNDTITMTVIGGSDNTGLTGNNSQTKSIPVQFEVKMAVTEQEDSITYLNFTTDDTAPKKLLTRYKIDNLGFKAFPINVTLFFPTKLEHDFEMTNYQVFVQENKTVCAKTEDKKTQDCSSEKQCKAVKCDTFILEKYSAVEFVLTGDVQFRDLKQLAANVDFLKRYTGDGAVVKFRSFLHVDYNKDRYVLQSFNQEKKSNQTALWKDKDLTTKWTEVRVELIFPPNQLQIILTGAGLGLLLLIIITIIMVKLGCFKRKKLEDDQDNTPGQFHNPIPAEYESDAETDQKPKEEKLLDDNEENGHFLQADEEKSTDVDLAPQDGFVYYFRPENVNQGYAPVPISNPLPAESESDAKTDQNPKEEDLPDD